MKRIPYVSNAVAYYRVSTQRQGRSGLGIEAQKAAVARFAEAEGIEIIGEHLEVETAKVLTRLIVDQSLLRHWRPPARRNVRCWSPSSIG